MTADLSSSRSPAMSVFSPVLLKSRWHAAFHLVFGRPLFVFPGRSVVNTFLIMCSSSLFITCTYPFNFLERAAGINVFYSIPRVEVAIYWTWIAVDSASVYSVVND